MSCGVVCRCGSDLELLWLWHRLAATAQIGPLGWKTPYATGTALEKTKRQKKKKKKKSFTTQMKLSFLGKNAIMTRKQTGKELWKVRKTGFLGHASLFFTM